MRIGIVGTGKMGREIEAAAASRGHDVVWRLGSKENARGRGPDRRNGFSDADVVFEFTNPGAAVAQSPGPRGRRRPRGLRNDRVEPGTAARYARRSSRGAGRSFTRRTSPSACGTSSSSRRARRASTSPAGIRGLPRRRAPRAKARRAVGHGAHGRDDLRDGDRQDASRHQRAGRDDPGHPPPRLRVAGGRGRDRPPRPEPGRVRQGRGLGRQSGSRAATGVYEFGEILEETWRLEPGLNSSAAGREAKARRAGWTGRDAGRRSSRRSTTRGGSTSGRSSGSSTGRSSAGIDFLVPCGTTGESATLSGDERKAVTAAVVKAAAGRVPVVAGAGGNHTAKAVFWARDAAEVGADGILSVSPMYNKPGPEGLFRHYSALSEATDLPILVYNVPGRTGSDLDVETILRLAEIPQDRRLEGGLRQLREDRAPDDGRCRRTSSCSPGTTRRRWR